MSDTALRLLDALHRAERLFAGGAEPRFACRQGAIMAGADPLTVRLLFERKRTAVLAARAAIAERPKRPPEPEGEA